MNDMGGLRKSMPITHITFLLACLAIAGIPPFAGFFSKEAILAAAFHGMLPIYYVALFTSGITSFYMFRLYFRIFWNKKSVDDHHHEKGNWAMNIPLILLSLGAVFAGFIPFGTFVSADGIAVQLPIHIVFSILPVSIGIIGIFVAWLLYQKQSEIPNAIINALGSFYRSASRKFYIDEVYLFITQKILFNLVARPAAWFDRNIVDGVMNGTATITILISENIKSIQNGRLQTYSMFFLGGVLIVAALLVMKFI